MPMRLANFASAAELHLLWPPNCACDPSWRASGVAGMYSKSNDASRLGTSKAEIAPHGLFLEPTLILGLSSRFEPLFDVGAGSLIELLRPLRHV